MRLIAKDSLYVGFCHYLFRKPLLAASFSGSSVGSKWDFVCYALFGVVITSSVQVAGILQVFSFLLLVVFVSSLFSVFPSVSFNLNFQIMLRIDI